MVFLGNLDECEKSVQYLVVFIFKQHLGYVFNIDTKRLGRDKRQLKAPRRRIIELWLLNDEINNLDEPFLVQVLQKQLVTLSQLWNEIIVFHNFVYREHASAVFHFLLRCDVLPIFIHVDVIPLE